MQTIHTITRVRFDLIRAVQIAANAPKKTALVSECPLGKLYVSGGVRSKNGTGRALEGELEGHIQQRRPDHRNREKFRFTSQLFQCKLNDDEGRQYGQ